MGESQCCPVCVRAAIPPRWPSVRTTAWTDDCACSDYSFCLAHRYGDEQPPKRPSQEVMTARAQAEFERACERHVEMLVQFMDYEELKKERDEARAEVAKHQASKFHPDWSLLQTCREELEEARAEAETLRAAIDGEP